MGPIRLVGAGLGFGQKLSGVELGASAWMHFFFSHYPELLKERPETRLVHEKFRSITVRSDSDFEQVVYYYKTLTKLVSKAHKDGFLPVTLGGDHSIGLATVGGSLRRHEGLKVLWVDAHGDINTPATSPTGSFHGMPLAHLLGLWDKYRSRPRLKPENLLLYGVRDLDMGEKRLIQKLNIKMITAEEIHERGSEVTLKEVSQFLGHNPTHVSFDVDAFDPTVFPQTGVPVKNGMNLEQGRALLRFLLDKSQLVAFDLVEYNPRLHRDRFQSVQTIMHLMGEFLVDLQRGRKAKNPSRSFYPGFSSSLASHKFLG